MANTYSTQSLQVSGEIYELIGEIEEVKTPNGDRGFDE
ncbi:hypothetical protein SynBIOSE41_03802 [Synechococcus sp. BIOS-E4-1]|nr:hypothetical protein SynBIOSE41_03802 [Synechococcus sp. BIOS-E4-1]